MTPYWEPKCFVCCSTNRLVVQQFHFVVNPHLQYELLFECGNTLSRCLHHHQRMNVLYSVTSLLCSVMDYAEQLIMANRLYSIFFVVSCKPVLQNESLCHFPQRQTNFPITKNRSFLPIPINIELLFCSHLFVFPANICSKTKGLQHFFFLQARSPIWTCVTFPAETNFLISKKYIIHFQYIYSVIIFNFSCELQKTAQWYKTFYACTTLFP